MSLSIPMELFVLDCTRIKQVCVSLTSFGASFKYFHWKRVLPLKYTVYVMMSQLFRSSGFVRVLHE